MSSWFRQLDNATSANEIVSITRDYFALWTPEEIALLPPACRPPRMRDATDLEQLHRATVGEYRKTRATGDELLLLQKLASFMTRACVRIAQVRKDASGAADSEPATQNPRKSAAGRGQ
jgi:hypothetical protein